MERIINILFYVTYKARVKLHYFFNKVFFIKSFYNLPFILKYFKKIGVDNPLQKFNNEMTDRKEAGIHSPTVTFISSISFIFFSINLCILKIINLEYLFKNKYLALFSMVFPSMLVNLIFIVHNDKYLSYFEKFDKWTKKEKRKYVIITILYYILVIILFFSSIFCKPYS